jgi:hypothetical protein
MAISKFRLGQALRSFGSLNEIISELTEQEVLACLDLEAASQRRRSILNRLISRAVRLNEVRYHRQLKEKIHGKSTSVPR